MAVLLPVLTLRRCDEEARRRLLWLMAGLIAALYIFLLYGALLVVYVLASSFGLDLPILAAAAFVTMPLPFLVFLLALWLGALFGGTLDPRVALRRTLIVGTLSAAGLFVFAVLEAAIADSALNQLGLSPGLGAWVAAASAAVAFRPVQKGIETRVERWLAPPHSTPDSSRGAL
jgi:hypothetical protein